MDGASMFASGSNLIANSMKGLSLGMEAHQKRKDEREALELQRQQDEANAYVMRNVAAQTDRSGMDSIFGSLANDPNALRASADAFTNAENIRTNRANQAQTYANVGLINANAGYVGANTKGKLLENTHTAYLNNREVSKNKAQDDAYVARYGHDYATHVASVNANNSAKGFYGSVDSFTEANVTHDFDNALRAGDTYNYLRDLKDNNNIAELNILHKNGRISDEVLNNLGVATDTLLAAQSDSIIRGIQTPEDASGQTPLLVDPRQNIVTDNQTIADNPSIVNTGTRLELANENNNVPGASTGNSLLQSAMQNANLIPGVDPNSNIPAGMLNTPTGVGNTGSTATTAVDANGNPVSVVVNPMSAEEEKAENNKQRLLQSLVTEQPEESIAPSASDIAKANAEQQAKAQKEAEAVPPTSNVDSNGKDENGYTPLNPNNPNSVRVDDKGNYVKTTNTKLNKALDILNKGNSEVLTDADRSQLRSTALDLSKEEIEEYGLTEDFMKSIMHGGTPKIFGNIDVRGRYDSQSDGYKSIKRYGLADTFLGFDPNTPLTEENIIRAVSNAIHDQGGAKSEENLLSPSVLKAASKDFPELRHKYTPETHGEIATKIGKKIYQDFMNNDHNKELQKIQGGSQPTAQSPTGVDNQQTPKQGGILNTFAQKAQQEKELKTKEKALKQAENFKSNAQQAVNSLVNGQVNRKNLKKTMPVITAVTNEATAALGQVKDELDIDLKALGLPKSKFLSKQGIVDEYREKDPKSDYYDVGNEGYKLLNNAYDTAKVMGVPEYLIPHVIEQGIGSKGINIDTVKNVSQNIVDTVKLRGASIRDKTEQIASLDSSIEALTGLTANLNALSRDKKYDNGNQSQRLVWNSSYNKTTEGFIEVLDNISRIVDRSYGANSP